MGHRQRENGRRDRFTIALAAIAVVGLVLRLGYIVASKGNTVGGDGRYYHLIAGQLADGKGFIAPQSYVDLGVVIPSAPHPPVWPLALTLLALVGLRSIFEQQVFACLVGAATIVMIGYAGRRVAGARVGLLAAFIAALYPNFWLYERELMSETLTLFGVALLVYSAYRFLARPTLLGAVAMGAVCGLLALTHADALLLVVVLTVPLALLARSVPAGSRVRWATAAVAVTAVLAAPWAIYNSARFHAPVLLGTEFGVTVAISNCEPTYHGKLIGFQEDGCAAAAYQAGKITGDNEAHRDDQLLAVGVRYATEHPTRALLAIAAREGRVWGAFRPFQQMRRRVYPECA